MAEYSWGAVAGASSAPGGAADREAVNFELNVSGTATYTVPAGKNFEAVATMVTGQFGWAQVFVNGQLVVQLNAENNYTFPYLVAGPGDQISVGGPNVIAHFGGYLTPA